MKTILFLIGLIVTIISTTISTEIVEVSKTFVPDHSCVDSTHVICDGECECDGFECYK